MYERKGVKQAHWSREIVKGAVGNTIADLAKFAKQNTTKQRLQRKSYKDKEFKAREFCRIAPRKVGVSGPKLSPEESSFGSCSNGK